jgi:DNA polymerase III sliding clamp (beta) subunit (PCNA family)
MTGLLNKVAPVIPSSAVLPIIQCVRVQGCPESFTVTATKLDNSIIVKSEEVQTIDTFDVVFPFKRLKEIITKADSGDLEVTIANGVATLVSGAASWDIQLPSGDSFPVIPEVVSSFTIEASSFKDSFNLVRKFASTDVTRPSLRMVHIANAKMTGCDGIKFTQVSLQDFPVEVSLDIPSASSDFVTHVLKDVEKLSIGQTDTHILIEGEYCKLIINKPTSTFPNVEQIMLRPALENKTTLRMERTDLLRAVSRVRVNADPDTEAIGLAVSAGSVTVSAKDMAGNKALETIPAQWSAKDRVLIVNCGLLTQLLNASSEDECTLYLGEDTKSRKSVLLLKDPTGVVSLIPQMSGSIRIF